MKNNQKRKSFKIWAQTTNSSWSNARNPMKRLLLSRIRIRRAQQDLPTLLCNPSFWIAIDNRKNAVMILINYSKRIWPLLRSKVKLRDRCQSPGTIQQRPSFLQILMTMMKVIRYLLKRQKIFRLRSNLVTLKSQSKRCGISMRLLRKKVFKIVIMFRLRTNNQRN